MKIFTKKIIIGGMALISIMAIVFIVVKINTNTVPGVISVNPTDNAQGVSIDRQITIGFDSNITNSSKKNISITLNPNIDFDSVWTNNFYVITPKNNLQNSEKYTVNVLYQGKTIDSFSFVTISSSQNSASTQSQDDYLYGQALISLDSKYPFYKNLPIRTSNYVVYYDFNQNKFAITFLVQTKSTDQKDQLINEALSKIKAIGAKDPIEYYTRP